MSSHKVDGSSVSRNELKDDLFQVRESLLTSSLRSSKSLRGLYSIIAALCIITALTNLCKYIIRPDDFWSDVRFLQRAFASLHLFLLYEVSMNIFVVALLSSLRYTGRRISVVLITVLFAVILIVPLFIRFTSDPHEVIGTAITFEQIRFTMKCISFVSEKESFSPEIGSISYFLFAPTLIYRDSYPRAKRRDWINIVHWSMAIFFMMWFTLIILNGRNGFLETFSRVGTKKLTAVDYFELVQQSSLLALMNHLAVGYAFLHCWLNIWSEILMFGDRMFYKNWLVTEGMFEMFTLWNYVVHSWIKRYVYKPIIRRCNSPYVATLVSFLISFFVHDYIIAVSLKILFFPFTFIVLNAALFAVIPFTLERITRLQIMHRPDVEASRETTPKSFNIHFFCFLTLGNILIVSITALRYYESFNCQNSPTSHQKIMSPLTAHSTECS